MFEWIKRGKVFDPRHYQGIPWLKEYAEAPATLVFDDFVRVYFSCRPDRDENGQFVSFSAFVDLDRSDLFRIVNLATQPLLDLGKKGCFDEFGTYPVSVVRNGDEVWAYYGGWTRCVSVPFNVAIGTARSSDNGETFQRVGNGPVLPYSPNEPFTMGGPKIRRFGDKFHLFYVAGNKWLTIEGRSEISHRIRLATSDDGLTWEKHGVDLIPNAWDEHESQASPDVFYANGRYHMFFCGWVPKNFRDTRNRKIGYASSDDLLHWTRDDAKAGMRCSRRG